jgi:uroporphyrinogen decarboxylase
MPKNESPLFLQALRRQRVSRPPVWFMRQAGRYLPEYREIRAQNTFLTLVKNSELATEVTLQPIRRFHFDASIVFSDILVVPEAMGQKLEFGIGEGPKLSPCIETQQDINTLRTLDAKRDTPFIIDTVQRLLRALPYHVPLIGFAGAPFTIACYMIEGQGSKNWDKTKSFLYKNPELFQLLLEKIEESTIPYLKAQVDAGARVLQLFDTWAGILAPTDLIDSALSSAKRVIKAAQQFGVPVIYFAKGCGGNLDLVAQVEADAYGVDWMTRLSHADRAFQNAAIQGNLDPMLLFADKRTIQNQVEKILNDFGERPGFILNLGHGILPQTPIESVQAVLETVHNYANRL